MFYLVVATRGKILEECTCRADADRIARAYHRAGLTSAAVVRSTSPGGVKFR